MTSDNQRPPPLHVAEDIRALLLKFKDVKAPSASDLDELRKISKLDVTKYTEADVRAEVIDPVVRMLGYRKEHYFSLTREKNLKFLDKDRYIDYEMTLWSESFWVIEAKRVKRKELRFAREDLEQVLCYAAHPDVNAALMVLCDGRLFEIYDREESLVDPVERVEVRSLADEFHKLQRLLSPWQSWFFQKRRIPRLVNKVMGHEMNIGRLDEIREQLNLELERKRSIITDNRRKLLATKDQAGERVEFISSLGLSDLINDQMFLVGSEWDCSAVVNAVVEKGGADGFQALSRIFPDRPRDMSDQFVAMSLRVLIAYESKGVQVSWLPGWLVSPRYPADTEEAIQKLIALALDSFSADPARKVILQYSACARRIAKILAALVPTASRLGSLQHEQVRYFVDELSEAQLLSTPAGHTLRALTSQQGHMTSIFVRKCSGNYGGFELSRALTELKDAWSAERSLLQDGTEYWTSLEGRGLSDELAPTEHNWVTYDNLGHLALCMLTHSSRWTGYVKANHRDDLMRLAATGSWKASELLEEYLVHDRISENQFADRFFSGSLDAFKSIRNAYSKR